LFDWPGDARFVRFCLLASTGIDIFPLALLSGLLSLLSSCRFLNSSFYLMMKGMPDRSTAIIKSRKPGTGAFGTILVKPRCLVNFTPSGVLLWAFMLRSSITHSSRLGQWARTQPACGPSHIAGCFMPS